MSFNFDGMVLRGATSGGTNAQTTALSTSGVLRDVKENSNSSLSAHNPNAIDLHADQYRASYLLSPNQTTSEYIVWASNTGKISAIVGDINDGGDPYLKSSGLSLSFSSSGKTILIFNEDNNSIDSVFGITVVNTSTNTSYLLTTSANPSVTLTQYSASVLVSNAFESFDLESGIMKVRQVVLDDYFSGGFDGERDGFISYSYFLAPVKFYWTRNDKYQNRFFFDYRVQSWRLIKGTSTLLLGVVNLGSKYPLIPKPNDLIIGSYLQGSSTNTDSFSLLRVGRLPNSGSLPLAENPSGVFTGVLVVADSDVNDEYDFSAHTPQPSAIVGENNALLLFNPLFVLEKAGQNLWYSYTDFVESSIGLVGPLENADFTPLFISPIPKSFERPFIKVGNRRYLSPILVKNDSELGGLAISSEMEVGISLSTGQLKFHSDLIGKAQRDNVLFDPNYLDEVVYYDGVALNSVPQPLRQAVPLVDSTNTPVSITDSNNGKVYVPIADPYGSNGLGKSGVLHQPDGSGVPFNLSVTTDGDAKIGIRENGDSESETASGLVREIIPRTLGMPDLLCLGDTFLFTSDACISVKSVDKVETENLTKMSTFAFSIKGTVAEITREGVASLPSGFGSAVKVSHQSKKNLGSTELVYFIQTIFTPSTYTNKARVVSKLKDTFNFLIGDTLVFSIDNVPYSWTAQQVSFTTDTLIQSIIDTSVEISTGLTNLASTTLTIENNFGYLIFECDQNIEIGFGLNGVKDLSGCAKIGLNPGWVAVNGQDNWLSDSGVSFGLERSPLNNDGTGGVADFYALYRLTDQRISPTNGLTAQPVLFLDYAPLQDIAGYDENVFFRSLTSKIVNGTEIFIPKFLRNYEDIVHRFGERHIIFIENTDMDTAQKIENTASVLSLGATQVIPQTLYGVPPNPHFGFFVSDQGSALERKTLGEDYLVDTTSGLATLIKRYGTLLSFDFLGKWAENTDTFNNQFSDTDNFMNLGVTVGDKLKILSGDSQGYYIVEEIIDENNLRVSPNFLKGNGDYPIAWELYDGTSRDTYDPSLLVDISYKPFNHLAEEPLNIRLLSWVGIVGQAPTNFILDLAESLANNHQISLRYTTSGDEVSLHRLVVEKLGIIANQSLFIDLTPKVLLGYFSISIGIDIFTPTLVEDASWSGYSFNPTEVYVNKVTGEIRFGDDLLSQYSNGDVYYVENFTPTSEIPSGSAEFNAFTGQCLISETDRINHQGESLYFVQEMNTSGELDVACNPLGGSVLFLNPLKERRLVEMEYYLADDLGEKLLDEETNQPIQIKEFLPLYVRSERCTFVEPNVFSFNPSDADGFQRTLFSEITPRVVVNGFQCNYGGVEDCVILGNEITFKFENEDIDNSSVVTISYAVLESFGGEQVYNTSQRPLYRPSFYIEQDLDTFTLETDRTADLQVGSIFRLGADNFYIKSVSYDSTTDETTVTIFPPTITEVGSRSPNNDTLTLVSSEPVAHYVDPNDPQSTTARTGFLISLSDSLFGDPDWLPVNRGQSKIEFLGDLTKFAVGGHIIEIGGVPFTISQSNLSDDGLKTVVEIISVFPQGFAKGTDSIYLSVRPAYPPTPNAFLGLGAVLPTQPYSVVLFGERDKDNNEKAGRELIQGVHYDINTDTGDVVLLSPLQTPLLPTQSIYIHYTKVEVLSPYTDPNSQTLVIPRYYSKAKVISTPSDENNLLGALIQTTNTFYSPDTFYTRVVPLITFSSETVQRLSSFSNSNPQGPISSVSDDPQSFDKGRPSLETQRSNIIDDDRSAKLFLEFYNVAVNSFEQVSETITGKIVGDRDGKFRYFIGRGKEVAPKGYECPITGVLNPRNIWGEVFEAESGFAFDKSDDLLKPDTATLVSAEIDGDNLDQDVWETLSARQKQMVKNDIDDVLLISRGRWRFEWNSYVPSIYRKGVFRDGSVPSVYSRLFPEEAKTFLLTYPGLQYDLTKRTTATTREEWSGWYSFSRVIEPSSFSFDKGFQKAKRASTRNQEIGVISNPALGEIKNIQDTILGRRYPRARIFAYYPDGVEADAFGTGFPSSAISNPCVLATPLELSEFPIDPTTGLPNLSVLIANGGDVIDLSTGDPELRTPSFIDFELTRQVAFGYPNGDTITPVYSEESESGIFIEDVQFGCLITFSAGLSSPASISSSDQITDVDVEGNPSDVVALERGDTIFLVPPVGSFDLEGINDPIEQDDLSELGKLENIYDVFVDRNTGRLLDRTFINHTKDGDKWFSGSWFGRNPPLPLSELEGLVSFTYSDMNFFEFPALRGEDKDDDGDYSIPYLKTKATERDRFGEITRITSTLLSLVSPSGFYVFADEIRDDNGFIKGALTGTIPPCALITEKRHNPHSFLNTAIGKNDTEQFDLLLMEYLSNVNLPLASQGILSVGRVYRNQLETLDGSGGGTVSDYSVIEPPRFISPTAKSSAHRYQLFNAMVHIHDNTEWDWANGAPPNGGYTDTNTSGITIHEDNDPINPKIVLDFSSLGQIELGDGTGNGVGSADPVDPLTWGGVGGFNRVISGASAISNEITIVIFAREKTTSAVVTRDPNAGDILLTLRITANGTQLEIFYTDGTTATFGITSAVFGKYDPLQQSGSVDDFKCVVLELLGPNAINLPLHTEIPHTTVGNVSTTDYAFDFSIGIDTISSSTVTQGSTTANIERDRLTFSECFDLRYARARGYRHPVGKRPLNTLLVIDGVDTQDFDGNDQSMVLTDTATSFTFLERDSEHLDPVPSNTELHFGIGTFSSASIHNQGDESGTLRVMPLEGTVDFVDLSINPPTITITVEDIDDTGNGIIDRFGVITKVTVTDSGDAVGLSGSLIVIIVGAGYGAQIVAELDENGDLPLGDLTILNGGRSYTPTPSITFFHSENDVQVIAEDITFALVPSSIEDENGIISSGSARLESGSEDTILINPQIGFGSLSNVEKGDIVVVSASANNSTYTYGDGTAQSFPHATNVCGTYLVRQSLESNLFGIGHYSLDLGQTAHKVTKGARLPSQTGWARLTFPTVTGVNNATSQVFLDADVRYADSPSGHYFGETGVISHLEITTPGSGFTEEDIGQRFTIGTDCIVEIVGVDYVSNSVIELAIIDRGSGFSVSGTWSVSPLGGGVNCAGTYTPVTEKRVFFILNKNSALTIAISCPFYTISTPTSTSQVYVNINTLGTSISEVYYGNTQLDGAYPYGLTLPNGSVTVINNLSELQDFFWDTIVGSKMGGHKYIPIDLRKNDQSERYVGKRYMRDSNTGYLHHISSYGFTALTFKNEDDTVPLDYVSYYTRGTGTKSEIISERFGKNEIGIVSKEKTSSTSFLADKDTIIFDNTPTMLDLQSIEDDPNLFTLPFASLHPRANCLVMGDFIGISTLNYNSPDIVTGANSLTGDLDKDGFIAVDGIYTEPSFPKPAQNYIKGNQRVVEDTSPTVDIGEIGYRRSTYDEKVLFQVKRIRRFHDIQTELQGSIHPLRYAYEVRRGVPTDYSVNHKGVGVLTASGFTFEIDNPAYENPTKTYVGTQLGEFDDVDVNIESGDIVRLLFNGELVETAEIMRLGEKVGSSPVQDTRQKISLRAPAFENSDFLNAVSTGVFTGWSYEIYLRNAIIPHEQSNEELLSIITERVVMSTRADYTNQLGGYVPHIPLLSQTLNGQGEIDPETGNPKAWTNYINKLYDDLNAPNPNDYSIKGVQVGDIVLVDKAGILQGATGPLDVVERGSRPFGDLGIIEREDNGANSVIGRNAYEVGSTSPLDDNRGFYRVTKIEDDHLVLQSGYKNEFVGTYSGDRTFPEDVSLKSTLGFSIYPTIHNSNLNNGNFFASTDDREGQMDLRPTQYAGVRNDGTLHPDSDKHNSFAVNDFSIRPFSYKIIRPSNLFSEETIEFVLMIRERMSSLIEHLKSFMVLEKSGDYYDFQDNQHIEDIGTPTIAETGLGVYHNAYLEDILGRMDLSPFGNDSDCLSLLDRRFIIQDGQLDTLCPDNTGVGSGLVSSLGGVPYTAFQDISGFYSGINGSLVRPLLLDHIEIILNDRDKFRALRSTWINYRTHRTNGLLARVRQFDDRIEERIKDQEDYFLRLKSQK